MLQVIWLDARGFTLTYDARRVIDDERFSVRRPYTNEWNLELSDVTLRDSGAYRCTVNTQPVKYKLVTLSVIGYCCCFLGYFRTRSE